MTISNLSIKPAYKDYEELEQGFNAFLDAVSNLFSAIKRKIEGNARPLTEEEKELLPKPPKPPLERLSIRQIYPSEPPYIKPGFHKK